METEHINILSRTGKGRSTCRDIKAVLRKKGIESRGPASYPKVSISEMVRVVCKNEQPSQKSHNWLYHITSESVQSFRQSSGSAKVCGYHFKFQRRMNFDGETLLESLDTPPAGTVIQISRTQADPIVMKHAPFSYDPAQDYYTEP